MFLGSDFTSLFFSIDFRFEAVKWIWITFTEYADSSGCEKIVVL